METKERQGERSRACVSVCVIGIGIIREEYLRVGCGAALYSR